MNTTFCQQTRSAKLNFLKMFAVGSAIIFTAVFAVPSRATFTPSGSPISLVSLLSGETFSSGDKLFTNWQHNSLNIPANTIAITPGFDNFGFGFRITSTDFSVTAGMMKDALLLYTVTSTGTPITGVHLAFDGSSSNGGHASVVEQVWNSTGILGQFAVFNPPAFMSDTLVLETPQQQLLINKDIFLIGQASGIASIDYIDQTFPQNGRGGPGGEPGAIPEPSTAALLSVGIGLISWTLWRKRKRAE